MSVCISINQKNIFLLDGVGAATSAVSTGLVAPLFFEQLGIPIEILRYLAILPLMYCFYSLTCYWQTDQTKPWMILVIALANLLYCLITGSYMIFSNHVSTLGQVLLTLEILIVSAVVAIELIVYRQGQLKYQLF